MWTIVKFDKKKIEDLKKNFNKKLGSNSIFTFLKLKYKRNLENKIKDYDFDVLGDYAFCYHQNISNNSIFTFIKKYHWTKNIF